MRDADFLTLFILATLLSCKGPECRNENHVFDSKPFASREYQLELANYLREHDTKSLSYWVEGYDEKGGKSFIVVSIKGKDLCAKALLEIPMSGPLSPIINTKGQGYIGAELDDLAFDVEETSEGIRLIYKDVGAIVD